MAHKVSVFDEAHTEACHGMENCVRPQRPPGITEEMEVAMIKAIKRILAEQKKNQDS
ncbi:MAG TPA: hypothetical protein PLO06_04365 [Methanoregulaceae archaeon]|nr:hypothetical protein [Methanoregulaceae archaeon]HPD75544.1 hypothetical protein [Methanoregulaceae archaeon]